MNKQQSNMLQKVDKGTPQGNIHQSNSRFNKDNIDSAAKRNPVSQHVKNQQNFYESEQHLEQKLVNPQLEALNSIIHEYLVKNGYKKTLLTFQQETPVFTPPVEDQSKEKMGNILLNAFVKGQRDVFFSRWIQYVPLNLRLSDENSNKLEFYLQYLDTRGADLAKTSEFLAYYALPYINQPQQHLGLKHIFTPEWIEQLRTRLTEFLIQINGSSDKPFLNHIYDVFQNRGNQQNHSVNKTNENLSNYGEYTGNSNGKELVQRISQLEQNNAELVNIIQDFNMKYVSLQEKYFSISESAQANIIESQNKWIQIVQELLMVGNDAGLPILKGVVDALGKKLKQYQSFLNTNIEELMNQSHTLSQLGHYKTNVNESDISPIPNNGQEFFMQSNIEANKYLQNENPYPPLDFNKIKAILLSNEDPVLSCAVLQALRWRITKTKGAYFRREIVVSYASFDIIGCQQENFKLLETLLSQEPKIRGYSLRLINAMASDFFGRSYFVQSEDIVKILIDITVKQPGDTIIRRNSLGALQKLSLRKKPQIVMINGGIIQWLIKILKIEKEVLSEYSIEYATALLMNLSLRSAGKRLCQDPQLGVLKVLNELLEHQNVQVRTFVNGTLYSLLSRKHVREQAQSMGLEDQLSFLMENMDDRFSKQIQYIQDQLNSNAPDDDNLSDSNDEDNDVDDIEDEEEEIGDDEEHDNDQINESREVGENVLNRFVLTGKQATNQSMMTKSIVDETMYNSQMMMKKTQKLSGDESQFKRTVTPQHSNINKNEKTLGSSIKLDRSNLPSEMKSRPKIVRTPINAERNESEFYQENNSQVNEKPLNQSSHLNQPPLFPPIHNGPQNQLQNSMANSSDQELKQIQQQKEEVDESSPEFQLGFTQQDQIPRTPPIGYNPRR